MPDPTTLASPPARYFGLDWLRIGAFGLLILYHIGMLFVTWDYHVKSAFPVPWLEQPMAFLNPWRLALLFFISGIATRFLWRKLGSAGRFSARRSATLLLPLLAGMALWVAPQPWAQIRERTDYDGAFADFWPQTYFSFQQIAGADLPTWNHLWFVAYLWVFNMLLALALLLTSAGTRLRAQRMFDRALAGPLGLVVPILGFAVIRLALFSRFGETHSLIDDPFGLLFYGFAFALGFGAARSEALLGFAARNWGWLLVGSLLAYAGRQGFNAAYAEVEEVPLAAQAIGQCTRAAQIWLTILGLTGLAIDRLQIDNRVRRYLSEAVFPFYIAHQTIIILVSHWQRPLALGADLEAAILIPATLFGCLAFHELGRRAGRFRPMFGLSRARASEQQRANSAG